MRKIKMGFFDTVFICLLLIELTGAAEVKTIYIVAPIMFEMGIGLIEGFIEYYKQNKD